MGAIHNDRRLQSGRSWSNGDQSESIVHVTRLLRLWPTESDYAGDADLSLLTMRSGHPPGPQRRETNRTEGAGSPFGEQARCRLRRTENLPGDRPGIPRHNAVAFGGGRMSILTTISHLGDKTMKKVFGNTRSTSRLRYILSLGLALCALSQQSVWSQDLAAPQHEDAAALDS